MHPGQARVTTGQARVRTVQARVRTVQARVRTVQAPITVQAEPGIVHVGPPGSLDAGTSQLRLVGTERQGGTRQFLAESPGQGEPEHRPLPALSPCLQPPAVQPGVLECDGQAKPGTAGGARAGWIGPPETVEDQVLLARPETHSMVLDGDRNRVPVGGDRDHDIASFAVLDRIVEQVAQDPLHAAPIDFGDTWLGGQPEIDPGALAGCQLLRVRGCPAHQVADVRRLGIQGRYVGVVPADLQQVSEQCLEPLKLALQQLGAAPGRRDRAGSSPRKERQRRS